MRMDTKRKKGQAGLDFLMTYGWALLIIVLIIAALFALGVFDVGSFVGSRASGFTEIGVVGWNLADNGDFTIMLENHAGKSVTIDEINATYKTESIGYSTPIDLGNGMRTGTLSVGTFTSPDAAGSPFTITVGVAYTDSETGFEYSDSGTVTGTVE